MDAIALSHCLAEKRSNHLLSRWRCAAGDAVYVVYVFCLACSYFDMLCMVIIRLLTVDC